MKHGLVLGKFLPYHAGHAHLIRTARARVDRLTVLACSVRAEPIPGAVRFRWVRDAHPDCHVVPVTDEVPQTPDEHPEFWTIWTRIVERHAGRVDVVFSSEDYGPDLARRLGAEHVMVDRERRAVPISGSAIRANPIRHWAFVPPVVRPWYALRVALLGPESVGKTTLSRALAAAFATAWVPEYGRDYCETRPALELEIPDFEAIVWGQATWEDEIARDANRVLICDTELHTTCTWSDMVVGWRPDWLTTAARARHYDLVLLLGADVPWVQDGLRVLEQRRAEHVDRLRAELRAAGRTWVELHGSFDERTGAAMRAVRELVERAGGE